MIKIEPTDELRTWELGEFEGKPQTEKAQKHIDKILINHPDEEISTGESFDQFSTRILDKVKEIIKTAPKDTLIITHNSCYGLIKLWNEEGRPNELDEKFRIAYTKQGSETADHFEIKGENGAIYIMRHGETQDNVDNKFRRADTNLTEEGIKQVEKVRDKLKGKISEIICSSLPRTEHTAEIMAENKKEDVEPPKESTEGKGKEETKREEAKETGPKDVAEFIDCFLTGAAIAHKMHLRETGPGSFAAHLALEELYKALPKHADKIAEACQGHRGELLPQVSESNQMEYLKMPHLVYIEYLIKYAESNRTCFGDVSPLQNLVDELLGTLYIVRYKLKFLS